MGDDDDWNFTTKFTIADLENASKPPNTNNNNKTSRATPKKQKIISQPKPKTTKTSSSRRSRKIEPSVYLPTYTNKIISTVEEDCKSYAGRDALVKLRDALIELNKENKKLKKHIKSLKQRRSTKTSS